jgi:hypothetical protein
MSVNLQNAVKNVKPAGDNTVIGDISLNAIFQQFIPTLKVTRSSISSPYIYIYFDVPSSQLIQTDNETAKKLIDSAQLRLTIREAELMQILMTNEVDIEGFRQDGNDVMIVVKVKMNMEQTKVTAQEAKEGGNVQW